MRRRRALLPAALGVLVLGALAFAIVAAKNSSTGPTTTSPAVTPSSQTPGAVSSPSGFEGAAVPGAKAAPGFTLSDQYGRTVSLASLRGRPVVLAFLYSRCGGPCVLIAQQIRGALDELAGAPPAVAIVSADPAGDTPASIKRFLGEVSLSGRVEYLTGDPSRVSRVWKAYGVRPAAAGSAAFAKFATVHLLDSKGHERVLYGTEQLTPEALAHDVRKLDGEPAGP